jgi:hypothetical protein
VNPVNAFEDAILSQRVATRYSTEHEGMEFPSQEALDKYLQSHPKADKSKHKVRRTEKDYQKSEDYKTKKDPDYYPKKMPEGMKLPEIPAKWKEMAEGMPEEDLDKSRAYNHPAVKKLTKKFVSDLKSKKITVEELGKAYQEVMDLKSKHGEKMRDAKTDAEADPHRFAMRKLYKVWQAINAAGQEYNKPEFFDKAIK